MTAIGFTMFFFGCLLICVIGDWPGVKVALPILFCTVIGFLLMFAGFFLYMWMVLP